MRRFRKSTGSGRPANLLSDRRRLRLGSSLGLRFVRLFDFRFSHLIERWLRAGPGKSAAICRTKQASLPGGSLAPDWLDRAVREGRILKLKKPVRCASAAPALFTN